MVTSSILSQSIKKDSVTINKKTFVSIVKESRKCDSIKSAFWKKDVLINDMVQNNVNMFDEFMKERALKQEAIKDRSAAQEELKEFNNKRFGIGFSIGIGATPDFEFKPIVALTLHYTLIRF